MNWLDRFLQARRLDQPDGRPLYAYRCSEAEYQSLNQLLALTVTMVDGGQQNNLFQRLFCLYAAESWRRNHAGGPWRWETVLAGIHLNNTSYQQVVLWTCCGLSYWQRPLIQLTHHTAYLLTVACEGGLPLKLIHREGANLRHYFEALLLDTQRDQRPDSDPVQRARRLADRLPRSLRQEVVFTLCGNLINTIWQLQSRLGDTRNPLADLDRLQPDWREQLPLRLDDAEADALLKNLVQQAVEIGRRQTTVFRWRRFLVNTGDGWTLQQRLDMPTSLCLSHLNTLAQKTLPAAARLTLTVLNAGDELPVAVATQVSPGHDPHYRLESLRRGKGLTFQAAEAAQEQHILLNTPAQSVGTLTLPGGQALSDLPWVFANRSEDAPTREWEWRGEGSTRLRQTGAWVAALPGVRPQPEPGATCERLAEQPLLLGRYLYRITGTVAFVDADNGYCRIRCAQEEDSAEEFRLQGTQLRVAEQQRIFVGVPRLVRLDEQGLPQAVPPHKLEWRSLNGGAWRRDMTAARGDLWLRYVDSGELKVRLRAAVLPRETVLQFQPQSERTGTVIITGCPDAQISIAPHPVLQSEVSQLGQEQRVSCTAQGPLTQDRLTLNLYWPAGQQLEVSLPLPFTGGRFVNGDGTALAACETLSLTRLGGAKATAAALGGGAAFWVEGRLRADDLDADLSRVLWLQQPLAVVDNRRYELPLRRLQERMIELFSATSDLDASIELSLTSHNGCLHTIRIKRFDLVLQPNMAERSVQLTEPSRQHLATAACERLHTALQPLWDPNCDPSPLEPVRENDGWSVPPALEAGPWLITGYDGEWARIRPLLWIEQDATATVAATEPATTLADAIRLADRLMREQSFATIFARLAAQPTDPEWEQVFSYLDAYSDLPKAALDLNRALAADPAALVTALLLAGENRFSLVWTLADELPCSWFLVPASCWLTQARQLQAALQTQLAEVAAIAHLDINKLIEDTFEPFFRKAPLQQGYLGLIVAWLQESLFPGRAAASPYLRMVRSAFGRQALHNSLEERQKMLNAAHAEDDWPEGPRIQEWLDNPLLMDDIAELHVWPGNFRESVCNAPVVAAALSVKGLGCEPAGLYELRRLRAFDPDYFDEAYALALSVLLGKVLEQRPEVLA